MSKISLLIGFAVGYAVGTVQGRAQFERITRAVRTLWERPDVKRTVKKIDDFVADRAPGLRDAVGAATGATPVPSAAAGSQS